MYLHSAFKKESEELEQMKRVERGKDMDSLLYDLLTTQSHKSFGEDAVRKIITDYLGAKTKFETDSKGNLYINVFKKKKTTSKGMFSAVASFSFKPTLAISGSEKVHQGITL